MSSQASAVSHNYKLAKSRAVLDAIGDPEINLAIWQRRLPFTTQIALREWSRTAPKAIDTIVGATGNNWSSHLVGIREPVRTWVLEDIEHLTAIFLRLSGSPRARLVWGVVHGDQCKKFHVDHVRFRLISTYLGPGTEWVRNIDVSYDALKTPPDCATEANRKIVRDPSKVRHAAAGDVLLMKGAAQSGTTPVVHRSPPIEGSGMNRVVLTISTPGG